MPESIPLEELDGSRYASAEQRLPQNVEDFKALIGRTIIDARPVGVPIQDADTFETDDVVSAISAAIGGGYGKLNRLYAASPEEAKALSGKVQNVAVARTTTAESSAHQVFFGKLTGSGGEERVAIKPFIQEGGTGGHQKVSQEWANTVTIHNRGYAAFKPVGFIPMNEGGYMLSARRDDVDPLDGIEWSGILSSPEVHAGKIADLKKIAPLMAKMHHDGIIHGDPQLKNFVIDERGKVQAIDFESAYVEPKATMFKPENADALLRRTKRDMLVLFSSLARSTEDTGVGLLTNMTPQTQLSYFDELVLQPYLQTRLGLLEAEGTDNESALDLLGTVEAEVEEYIRSNELQASILRIRKRIGATAGAE